jgi:hypothetical protein
MLRIWMQSPLLQVNRFRKSRDRALLLTDRFLYKLEPGRQYRVMRAVPLEAVSTTCGGWEPASGCWGAHTHCLPVMSQSILKPRQWMAASL